MGAGGISFVLPAKEEGLHIEETLSELYEVYQAQDYEFEMICIDDGSTDDTHDRMLAFAEGKPEVTVLGLTCNRGIGYTIRLGYSMAKQDYVMFVPTNGMLDPHSMFHKLGERSPERILLFDVENFSERPFLRKLPSATYNAVMTRLLEIDVGYVHAMALIPREAILFEDLHSDRSFHVVEILAIALRKWKLEPVFLSNRIKRAVGVQRSKSFKLNNFTEIVLFSVRLRLRLRGL